MPYGYFCTVRSLFIALLLFISLPGSAQEPLPAVGLWREHLPYNSAIDLSSSSEKIYCATPYSIFSVDTRDNPITAGSVKRLSRITGLSETGISAIHFDEAGQKLFIAYSNSNIDILQNDQVFNIPDIKRDNIIADKTIFSIYPNGGDYYLSTGLGVIVIDGTRYEVRDSWLIGAGGNPVRVNSFTSDGDYFYAATAEGLKRTPILNANPADYSSWEMLSGTGGLPGGECRQVIYQQGKLVAESRDSLFFRTGNNWQLLYTDGWPIINTNAEEGRLLISQRQSTGASRVTILNMDGATERVLSQPGVISFPRKAILHQGDAWVADLFGCLSRFTPTSYDQFKPNSPQATASGELLATGDAFYATAGEVNDAWNYQYNGNGIFIFRSGEWNNINRFAFPQLDSMLDFISIAIDKRDQSPWAGSYGGGLLHILPGPGFEIFKQGFIGPAVGDPASYRVAGLSFDRENNLWISNYGASQPLRVRKADGNWQSFTLPFFVSENAVSQLLVDDNNYKWIVSPKGNGLICFDHGNTIDQAGDDRWKFYRGGAGNGNLPSSEVFCVARDKNGYIWVGTADGIGVIQCGIDIFSAGGCEAVLPVVREGSFANYLFKGEEVRYIAVDGADRKWVATRNGAWLISADGTKLISHFSETNSPLLSSDVRKIAIDPYTGEIYFATLKGICSFRGTATEGGETHRDVLVFPNPVSPGFSGWIAIRGLANNAIVKITEPDGRLVYQTRALGGQAVWDGRDYKGRKLVSGVYLVLVTDDARRKQWSGKIVFIGK